MSEHTVPLRKACGGSTVTDPETGETLTWEHDGDVVDTPYNLAGALLAIAGGGYSVADEKTAEPETVEITEPAPKAAGAVTEPVPAPRQPAHSRSAKK